MTSLFFGFVIVESMYREDVLLNFLGFKWLGNPFTFHPAGNIGPPLGSSLSLGCSGALLGALCGPPFVAIKRPSEPRKKMKR